MLLKLFFSLTVEDTRGFFVNSADQDQTAQNVPSDLCSTLSTLLFQIITELSLYFARELYSWPL